MTTSLAVCTACVALFASFAHAQQVLGSVNGASGERLGAAALEAGDQNADGYADLLVGAPKANFGNGAVLCVSGKHLATGAGASILWTAVQGISSGSAPAFGSSLAALGDVTGDGVPDFAVGAPDLDYAPVGTNGGAVYVLNGATHLTTNFIYGPTANQRFGASLARVGDVTGDGKSELAVGAPGVYQILSGGVSVLSGAGLASSGSFSALSVTVGANSGEDGFGTSLASGFDLDGDGSNDVAIGSPYYDNNAASAPDAGAVWIMRSTSPPGQSAHIYASYRSTVPGEHLGASVDARHDYDGDGVVDIVAGAPFFKNGTAFDVGRAVVISSARVIAQTLPYEIYSFPFGGVTPPVNHSDPDPDFHFGTAVEACEDLNNDGIGEILVGAPDYFTQNTFPSTGWSFRGIARVFSGATGTQLGNIAGGTTDRLGDAFSGAIGDLNGDGFKEFAVAGSLSDAGGADSGVVKCYRLFPTQPSIYCTGKTNSLGCVPAMSWSGNASATSATPFLITCSNVLNQVSGLLMYSHTPNAAPFQGGTLCVKPPLRRTSPQNSGGSASGTDCSGAFSLDFNARIQSGVDATLVVGSEAFTQYWSRDPGSASTTSLSNALRFVINP